MDIIIPSKRPFRYNCFSYNGDGKIISQEIKVNDVLHNEHGPALIEYWDYDVIRRKTWYNNGDIHSYNDNPAVIIYEKTLYGKMFIGTQLWKNHGKMERLNGPAAIHFREDGSKVCESWYKDGIFHREGGPAETFYTSTGSIMTSTWLVDGLKHNLEGPAYVRYNKNGIPYEYEWWVKGINISDDVKKWVKSLNKFPQNYRNWTRNNWVLFKLTFG